MTKPRLTKEERLAICEEIDRNGFPVKPSVDQIAERVDRSPNTIRGIYDRWVAAGRTIENLTPYVKLFKDKGTLLKKYNLTPKKIKSRLRLMGHSVKSWALSKGYTRDMVGRMINGERASEEQDKLMAILAREIDANEAKLCETIAQKELLRDRLNREIAALKRQLKP